MAVKKGEKLVNYRLGQIEILNIKLECPSGPKIGIDKFGFNISIEQNIDNVKKYVILFIDIKILSGNVSTQLGSLKISFIFEILNFDSFFNTKTDLASFPDSFYFTLHSILISTARGIMFSEFKGTFLHKAILPIINPKDLVQVAESIK